MGSGEANVGISVGDDGSGAVGSGVGVDGGAEEMARHKNSTKKNIEVKQVLVICPLKVELNVKRDGLTIHYTRAAEGIDHVHLAAPPSTLH